MSKYICLFIILSLLVKITEAQNSIRPNIYLLDMNYYNPAYIAIDSNERSLSSLYAKYKSVDNDDAIWDKPMNIWLNHVSRIANGDSFYTLSYINDQYSFFSRNSLYVGYTQQFKISQSSTFSYGGRVVANMDFLNWDKFELPHSRSGKSLYFNPDLDIGAAYQFKEWNAGIGLKNMFETSTKIEDATLLQNHRELNFNLSYRKNIGRYFAVTPFLLLAHERSTLTDAGLCFTVIEKVRASYALRVNELKSVIALDAAIYKGWSIGMAYDRSSLVSDNNLDFVIRYKR